jgi:hypothetical protein
MDVMNPHPFPGLSLFFILIFFAPLAVIVLFAFLFAERPRRWGKVVSALWLASCLPAAMLITMGYAFHPHGWNPIVQIAIWTLVGLAIIWIPLWFKAWLVLRFSPPEDRQAADGVSKKQASIRPESGSSPPGES